MTIRQENKDSWQEKPKSQNAFGLQRIDRPRWEQYL